MKIKISHLFIFILLISNQLNAFSVGYWNTKKCAVVLTYDDGLNVHLSNVIPTLNQYNFRGTFYLIGNSAKLNNNIEKWRAAANNGHELGNHSMFHPCMGGTPGTSWITKDKDLRYYTVDRAINEIKATNILLKAIDGKSERTFAYPCGNTYIDSVYYYKLLENDFLGARGTFSGINFANDIHFDYIKSYSLNGCTADYMIDLVNKAIQSEGLIVLMFHGVGGEHNINISNEEHQKLIQYLKKHEDEIWVTPLVEALKFIKSNPVTK